MVIVILSWIPLQFWTEKKCSQRDKERAKNSEKKHDSNPSPYSDKWTRCWQPFELEGLGGWPGCSRLGRADIVVLGSSPAAAGLEDSLGVVTLDNNGTIAKVASSSGSMVLGRSRTAAEVTGY